MSVKSLGSTTKDELRSSHSLKVSYIGIGISPKYGIGKMAESEFGY